MRTTHVNDRHPETRIAVAWALGRFGARAESALAPLASLTDDTSLSVREQAKLAISKISIHLAQGARPIPLPPAE